MAHQNSERPAAPGADRGRVTRTASKPLPATLEDRLEGKATTGDRKVYSGPGLDEMSREQRHKLLYGA